MNLRACKKRKQVHLHVLRINDWYGNVNEKLEKHAQVVLTNQVNYGMFA